MNLPLVTILKGHAMMSSTSAPSIILNMPTDALIYVAFKSLFTFHPMYKNTPLLYQRALRPFWHSSHSRYKCILILLFSLLVDFEGIKRYYKRNGMI